uniref:uncharacterized protein LOC109959645 isoform X1 n=1 Tax=Monopterus albus TaxID=43700 RepID=UPI0009B4E011|nr:uncharacterized protein LOC109959645 isoform X1 [Monopterus albus]
MALFPSHLSAVRNWHVSNDTKNRCLELATDRDGGRPMKRKWCSHYEPEQSPLLVHLVSMSKKLPSFHPQRLTCSQDLFVCSLARLLQSPVHRLLSPVWSTLSSYPFTITCHCWDANAASVPVPERVDIFNTTSVPVFQWVDATAIPVPEWADAAFAPVLLWVDTTIVPAPEWVNATSAPVSEWHNSTTASVPEGANTTSHP